MSLSASILCELAWSHTTVRELTMSDFLRIVALCKEGKFSVEPEEFQKLCQAFYSYSLQPLPSDATEQKDAWQSLCQMFHAQGLTASNYDSPAGRLVQDALSLLELQFEQDDTLGDYQPEAVLTQLSDNTTLVLVATNPKDDAAKALPWHSQVRFWQNLMTV